MKASGIYSITSPSGGVYIGSAVSLRNRWSSHRSRAAAGLHINPKLQNAFNKYGASAMRFEVLIVCRPEDLLLFEQRAIDLIEPKYNICKVAGNSLGLKRSAETKAKLAARLMGKKQSPETIAKRSASLTGRTVSQETREKLALQKGWRHSDIAIQKMKGRVVSPDQIDRMAERSKGNQNRKGAIIPAEMREAISAKLKGKKRAPAAIEKHRATMALRRAEAAARQMIQSVAYEVKE
jgi:group I intron endonuclease